MKAHPSLCLLLCLCLVLTGCSGTQEKTPHTADAAPRALALHLPTADGVTVYGSDNAQLDASHADQGYIMASYTGANPKPKLQITEPDGTTYTYNISPQMQAFPLTGGSGSYRIVFYENISGDQYATLFTQELPVTLTDEFGPYLYASQYCYFTADSAAVQKSAELSKGTDMEVITAVYDYVTKNITYDTQKAATVSAGYLPNVDDTLAAGTGICFDYASLMAAMLRAVGIPTRIEIGYAGDKYHAWISVYTKENGWINGVISFDGDKWTLMDPTLAASNGDEAVKEYVGDGSNYTTKYVY